MPWIFVCLMMGLLLPHQALAGQQKEDSTPVSPQVILTEALNRRFGLPRVEEVLLKDFEGGKETRTRTVVVATAFVSGKQHSRVEFLDGEDRGNGFLSIEENDRQDDQFVRLPALKKIRRVSGMTRQGPFFGTLLSNEDMERRHGEDFEITSLNRGLCPGGVEECFVAKTKPIYLEPGYQEVTFWVAVSDYAILKETLVGTNGKTKTVVSPRDKIEEIEKYRTPRFFEVSVTGTSATTQVEVTKRWPEEVDPKFFMSTNFEMAKDFRPQEGR